RIRAHACKAALPRLAADLENVRASGFRFKNGVIDQGCDGRVDLGETLAGGNAIRSRGDDFLGVARARLWAALCAARTHLVGQIQSLALLGHSSRGNSGKELFADLRNQDVEFRLSHVRLPGPASEIAARCR